MKRKQPRYDPDRSPDTAWWSPLPEEEQIDLVLEHHRRAGVQLPNANLHAVTHVVVENQVLLRDAVFGDLSKIDADNDAMNASLNP